MDEKKEREMIPNAAQIAKEEESIEKKNKWLYPTVIVILTLFFVVGFIYGLNSVLAMEGAFPAPVLTEPKTPPPETAEQLIDYLNTVVADAKREKPKFSRGASYDFDDGALSVDLSGDGEDTLRRSLLFIKNAAEEHLNRTAFSAAGQEPPVTEAEYFDGFDSLLNEPDFTVSDVESFTCSYLYYKCINCSKESDIPLENCADCGSEHPYQTAYRDDYDFEVVLKPTDALIERNFFPKDPFATIDALNPALADYAAITRLDETTGGLRFRFRVNRETDQLKSLTYEKQLNVTANVEFTGGCAALGFASLSAPLTVKHTYSFTWPAVELNLRTLSLEPKEKSNLLATLICDKPAEYSAVWSSSDPEAVSVDDEGYLKAGKKENVSAVITASFEFGGKTYSDACTVEVKYSVESMSLNKRHLTMRVNDTASLTATVSPKKATVKTATWYSEDETIVKADPTSGTLTAVAPGTVTVYALSDDGAFKSSCEVTVK